MKYQIKLMFKADNQPYNLIEEAEVESFDEAQDLLPKMVSNLKNYIK